MNAHSEKHSWFQIHLSTALVLMLVAGGLMWANTDGVPGAHDTETGKVAASLYGWPLLALFKFDSDFWASHPATSVSLPYCFICSYGSIAVDLCVAFIIFIVMWLICEWRICRRVARKGA